jgi:hypothetical protein
VAAVISTSTISARRASSRTTTAAASVSTTTFLVGVEATSLRQATLLVNGFNQKNR